MKPRLIKVLIMEVVPEEHNLKDGNLEMILNMFCHKVIHDSILVANGTWLTNGILCQNTFLHCHLKSPGRVQWLCKAVGDHVVATVKHYSGDKDYKDCEVA